MCQLFTFNQSNGTDRRQYILEVAIKEFRDYGKWYFVTKIGLVIENNF